MPYEVNVTNSRRTIIATADLSAKQFYAIEKGNVAAAGKACDGILQDKPVSGQSGCIAYGNGIISLAAISASQALTAGDTLLEVDTGGTLKVLASGTAVAKAMESLSSVAAIRIVSVQLLASNAPHA